MKNLKEKNFDSEKCLTFLLILFWKNFSKMLAMSLVYVSIVPWPFRSQFLPTSVIITDSNVGNMILTYQFIGVCDCWISKNLFIIPEYRKILKVKILHLFNNNFLTWILFFSVSFYQQNFRLFCRKNIILKTGTKDSVDTRRRRLVLITFAKGETQRRPLPLDVYKYVKIYKSLVQNALKLHLNFRETFVYNTCLI